MARRTAVYLIWCPELWPGPCYVGTAVRPRKRFGGHLRDARQGKSKGGADCVCAIWAADHQPKLTVWKWFDTEREAKKAEARFKELVRGNECLDLTNRHAGLETGADSEACARGGRKGGRKGAHALQKRIDNDPAFAAQMSEARRKGARKGGRKGGRKGAAAMLALKDADGKSVNARKGGRKGVRALQKRIDSDPGFAAQVSEARRKGGHKNGALYGRDDLVRYIRTQDPGSRNRTSRSRELAAEIERDHGIRVQPRTIRKIWLGRQYQHVK